MPRKTRKPAAARIVAEICLYGNSQVGAGWIARTASGTMLGYGVSVAGRSMTGAIFAACDEIAASGVKSGTVRVFAAGGQRMATTDLTSPVWFGQMKWEPVEAGSAGA